MGEAGGQRRVPVLAVRGEWGAGSLCLPAPVTYSSGFSPQRVSGWGLRPAGQRGKEELLPGVCHGKLQKPAQ